MPSEAMKSGDVFERHVDWSYHHYRAICRLIDVATDLRDAMRVLQSCTVADPSGQRVEALRRAHRRFATVANQLPALPSPIANGTEDRGE